MIDFSKHIVIETHYKDENTGHTLNIWDLKLPDSEYRNRIRFINSCGTLTVNGDFGNWVFCREFHPNAEDYNNIFSGYMTEKLHIHSEQTSATYDSERTLEAINEFEKQLIEEGKLENDIEDWIDVLKNNVYDRIDYEHVAYRDTPDNIDYEEIPYIETIHPRLVIVYEAFNELCKRQKDELEL